MIGKEVVHIKRVRTLKQGSAEGETGRAAVDAGIVQKGYIDDRRAWNYCEYSDPW